MEPNELQRENLAKLAAYLERLEVEPTLSGMAFDMNSFCSRQANDEDDIEDGLIDVTLEYRSCGTIACAIGHAPTAGIAIPDKARSWWRFSELAFGLKPIGSDWEFLFGCRWTYYDNTPRGVAERIKLYLSGDHPKNFNREIAISFRPFAAGWWLEKAGG